MEYFKKVIGEKCYLAPINSDDAHLYTKWLNNLDITRNLTLSTSNITLETEQDVLKNVLMKGHNYGIVDSESDELIGNCGFVSIDHVHGNGEIGIFIGDINYHGRGFGREALSLLLGYGFNYLNLHVIRLMVYKSNHSAIKCYEKTGFKHSGVFRDFIKQNGRRIDAVLMDITEDEYRDLYGESER